MWTRRWSSRRSVNSSVVMSSSRVPAATTTSHSAQASRWNGARPMPKWPRYAGWSLGKVSWRRHPVTTPTPVASAKRRRAGVAPSSATISPEITSGRRAVRISRAASATASRAGPGRGRAPAGATVTSPASPSVTSSGRTTTTGPGRPATVSRRARAVTSATAFAVAGSRTAFAIGAYMR